MFNKGDTVFVTELEPERVVDLQPKKILDKAKIISNVSSPDNRNYREVQLLDSGRFTYYDEDNIHYSKENAIEYLTLLNRENYEKKQTQIDMLAE